METLQFSHDYRKFPEGFEHSWLVEVLPITTDELGPIFREYDAVSKDGIMYPIPQKAKGLLLVMRTVGTGLLWTSVRQYEPAKKAYYKKHRGETFQCIIKEAPNGS